MALLMPSSYRPLENAILHGGERVKTAMWTKSQTDDRRSFIGGSDARIIMGNDEAALIRLWREKRSEVDPEDLSGNLIVQLGLVPRILEGNDAALVVRERK